MSGTVLSRAERIARLLDIARRAATELPRGGPYPSRAASEVWQQLMEEADATAFGRKIKKKDVYRVGFLIPIRPSSTGQITFSTRPSPTMIPATRAHESTTRLFRSTCPSSSLTRCD